MAQSDTYFNSLKGTEQSVMLPPGGSVANPLGFVAPAILQSDHSPKVKAEMAEVAAKLARDPIAMQLFCDRVYKLLSNDLKAQQERTYGYGRR